MTRYFTHYWTNKTAEKAQALGEDKLEWVASNGFVWRGVSAGDVVYPVTVVDGVLRLIGSLEVGRVCDLPAAREELGYDPWWEASDYLLATVPLPTRFDLEVPPETTRSLRFVGEGGSQPPVFVAPGCSTARPCAGYVSLPPRPQLR